MLKVTGFEDSRRRQNVDGGDQEWMKPVYRAMYEVSGNVMIKIFCIVLVLAARGLNAERAESRQHFRAECRPGGMPTTAKC